jgi:sugar transferase EpsL
MSKRAVALGAKRAMDFALALAALVLLAPLLSAIALALCLTQGRPALFRQVRPGLGGRPFSLVKFRTMRPRSPGEASSRTDAERLTRLGPFLRTTSLDELPELWNVLRGDMSLVGPRPLLLEYLREYTHEEHRRHHVRPGVTGWAVVNGRNTLAFRERLRLDVWYVDHWTLRLDLLILVRTAVQVLGRTSAAVTEDDAALGFPLVRAGEDSAVRGPDGAPGQLMAFPAEVAPKVAP